MAKPKILIVDDEESVRSTLKDILADCFECDIAESSDGRHALEVLEKEQFDLVLLDIKMPGLSGVDVLKNAALKHPQTDILMLSGWDSQSVAEEAFKDGATDYILKSSPPAVSCGKICAILKKRNKYFPKKKK